MIVRSATRFDYARLVELARQFYAVADLGVPWDTGSIVRWFEAMAAQELLLVAEIDSRVVGFVGGVMAPHPVNDKHLIGSEQMWWVEKEHRDSGAGIALLRAIEQKAQELGCDVWHMMCLEAVDPDRVSRIYIKEGYRSTERVFVKEL